MLDEYMVSIIVPVYNAEEYLDICIKSLVSQIYKDIEIILVNDCSTDKSLALCKAWSELNDRVKVFSLEKNSGPSAARNRGLKEARGEYITFVDADDWLDKNCIKETVEAAKESDADVVMWNLTNHYEKSQTLEKSLTGDERLFVGDEIKYLQEMMLTLKSETGDNALNLTGPYCKLYRAKVLSKAQFPTEINLGEDTCFVMQALQNSTRVWYIDKVYYHRVDVKHSLSHKKDVTYVNRRLDYTNWMLSYCMRENIASEKVWNTFVYLNLRSVVNKHIHVIPSLSQLSVINEIRHFTDRVIYRLNWDAVDEADEKIKKLLYNGKYWRYKVYFVSKNVRRLLARKSS